MSPVRPHSSPRPLRASQLAASARACVVGHDGEPGESERLAAMGLGVGATFEVARAGRAMTVRVGESTLALGESWAAALTVVEL